MPGATAAAGQRGEAAPGQAGQLPGSVVTNVHLLGRLGLMASSPSVTLKSRNTFFRPKKKHFIFGCSCTIRPWRTVFSCTR